MKINREEFLKQLESVLPGLSVKEIIEQSSCFIFKNGRVFTYNDEVACSQRSSAAIEGAVQALPLIAILRKLQEEEIIVTIGDGELLIKGKSHRRAGIRMEKDILLPIEAVDKPKKWKSLPEDFSDAIHIVQSCASSEESSFIMTCVHLHPKWIEATDNYQAARFKIKIHLNESILIRKDSLGYIVDLGMTKFCVTKNWAHFKNPSGLILSCRKFAEEYPDISKALKIKGNPMSLPKGLKDAAERAEVFSAEDPDDNKVTVKLQTNKLTITGRGASGWFKETKKMKYQGEGFLFTISPKLLIELVQQYNDCIISSERLKIRSGKFSYVTTLGKVGDNE